MMNEKEWFIDDLSEIIKKYGYYLQHFEIIEEKKEVKIILKMDPMALIVEVKK